MLDRTAWIYDLLAKEEGVRCTCLGTKKLDLMQLGKRTKVWVSWSRKSECSP